MFVLPEPETLQKICSVCSKLRNIHTARVWMNALLIFKFWGAFTNIMYRSTTKNLNLNTALWLLREFNYFSCSVGDFLSNTMWPLDIAKVTKVSRINIFKQKIKLCNFWAISMLYTSKEHIFHVEFKFKQKTMVHYWKIWKKFAFFCFGVKNEADQVSSMANFSNFWQQNSKMALPGVVKRFELKSHQIWVHYL